MCMGLKRKVCKIGNSFAVFIPKTWVTLLEEEHGKIENVSMEVNDKLTIRPILKDTEIS